METQMNELLYSCSLCNDLVLSEGRETHACFHEMFADGVVSFQPVLLRRNELGSPNRRDRSTEGVVISDPFASERTAFEMMRNPFFLGTLPSNLIFFDEERSQVPTPQNTINQLPIVTYKGKTLTRQNDEEMCMICLEKFNESERLRRLPCLHGFHVDCIDRWLFRASVCPICKLSLINQQH